MNKALFVLIFIFILLPNSVYADWYSYFFISNYVPELELLKLESRTMRGLQQVKDFSQKKYFDIGYYEYPNAANGKCTINGATVCWEYKPYIKSDDDWEYGGATDWGGELTLSIDGVVFFKDIPFGGEYSYRGNIIQSLTIYPYDDGIEMELIGYWKQGEYVTKHNPLPLTYEYLKKMGAEPCVREDGAHLSPVVVEIR